MIYIDGISNDPHFNLALEQYVFDEMDKSKEYFMFWQNHNSIIIGKFQNTIAEINQEYVKKNNISVVRRLSGGGAVYHDLGNLNFTFIVSEKDADSFNFTKFCTPIVKALSRLGVKAEINGRNDITIDFKKFSGNSQYSKNGRIMHHGTIMYDSDLDVVEKALNVSSDKIQSKGIKSVRSRVTTVKEHMLNDISIDDFKKLLLKYMFEDIDITEYKLTEKDIQRVKQIQNERYDKWEWNYGFSPKYDIVKERRFDGCGKLEIGMEVNDGIIKSFFVHGDYFGNGDSSDLAGLIIGRKIEENDIKDAIKDININYYFNNITKEDFVNLIIL